MRYVLAVLCLMSLDACKDPAIEAWEKMTRPGANGEPSEFDRSMQRSDQLSVDVTRAIARERGCGSECIAEGKCSFGGGMCYASTDDECAQSMACKAELRCYAFRSACVTASTKVRASE